MFCEVRHKNLAVSYFRIKKSQFKKKWEVGFIVKVFKCVHGVAVFIQATDLRSFKP